MVAALIVVGMSGAVPVLATGPTGAPVAGNVNPQFSSLAVGTGVNPGLNVNNNGILSNQIVAKPLTVSDNQGFLVTAGPGNFKVTNGGDMSNDGTLDVGSDANVNGDATAFDVNAWSTVKAPNITGTFHVKGVEIGAYTTGEFLYTTINAGASKNFTSANLTCPNGQIAMTCNYEAFSDVANCGTGSASVQSNNVQATKIRLTPQGGGWGTPKAGGYCNATLKNTGGSQICGMVEVDCWDPNG